MKKLFPDDVERLNHIFAKQVYGCAPTEIIYRICLRYILGFDDKIHIEKSNIKLLDTLEYAKDATLENELKKAFDLWIYNKMIYKYERIYQKTWIEKSGLYCQNPDDCMNRLEIPITLL